MRRVLFFTLLLAVSSPAVAKSAEERWEAESHTASAITGDMVLSPSRMLVAGHEFPLKIAGDLRQFKAEEGPVPARVLQVTQAMNPTLLQGNRLCDHSVRWIVVWHMGRQELDMAVFESRDLPTSVDDPGLCGTFSFSRP